jgi:hypothetical protein
MRNSIRVTMMTLLAVAGLVFTPNLMGADARANNRADR